MEATLAAEAVVTLLAAVVAITAAILAGGRTAAIVAAAAPRARTVMRAPAVTAAAGVAPRRPVAVARVRLVVTAGMPIAMAQAPLARATAAP